MSKYHHHAPPKSEKRNWWMPKINKQLEDNSGFGYTNRYKSNLGYGNYGLTSTTSMYTSTWNGFNGGTLSKESEEILKRAYQAVRDMVVILDFPFNVLVQLRNDKSQLGGNSVETRRVFVPTQVLTDENYTEEEKINTLCGLGAHESAHLLYTNYGEVVDFKVRIRNKIASPELCRFTLILFNVLEDERIENTLLQERPGYSGLIDQAKKYRSKIGLNLLASSLITTDAGKIMRTLYGLLRFPELINEEIILKYSDFFDEIKELLQFLPKDTSEVSVITLKIIELLQSHFIDNNKIKDHHIDHIIDRSTQIYDPILYGIDKDSNTNAPSELINSSIEYSEFINRIVSGEIFRGLDDNTYFCYEKENEQKYLNSYQQISSSINPLKKKITAYDKNYAFCIPGCRSGVLDTTKLAEAYQGVPQVYTKMGQVKTNKTSICVLIDESGSMGELNRYCSLCKDNLAQQAGVLVNEAFGKLPGIDLYIYGHTANEMGDYTTTVRIYKERDNFKPRHSLGNISARCGGNKDGTAILETATRVKSLLTTEKAIMLIISDGRPWAGNSYSGDFAVCDVNKKVKMVEKMGFDVIQISIDEVQDVEKMFDKFIDVQKDVSELPEKLGKIMQECIIEDKQTIVI